MIGYILLSLLLVNETPGACSANLKSDFKFQASWVAYHAVNTQILIDTNGLLRGKIWTTDVFDSLQTQPVHFERCLSAQELSSLMAVIKETSFMELPDDVSSPPFYADEPMAILDLTTDGRSHRSTASGLTRASTQDALRFKSLWEAVLKLSRKSHE